MHGVAADLPAALAIAKGLGGGASAALCPPTTLLARMARGLAGTGLLVGGQDCRAESAGPLTGGVSAEMLKDAGAALVILGHSERRIGCGDSDALVAAKARAALRADLCPIVCVGETLAQRRAGAALSVVIDQLRGSLPPSLAGAPFAVAYEPVWAIGTGEAPTPEDVEAMHGAIRKELVALFGAAARSTPVLYGGSVNPANAGDILRTPEVGGVLVGGGSLNPAAFLSILGAAARVSLRRSDT